MAKLTFYDIEGTERHIVNGDIVFKIDKKFHITCFSYDILEDSVWLQISDDHLKDRKEELYKIVKEKCKKFLKKG